MNKPDDMNEPKLRQQLAEFDLLLERLSHFASREETTASQMFEEVGKFTDAVIAPRATSIVAIGPRNAILLIHGSAALANEVHRAALKNPDREIEGEDSSPLQPSASNIAIQEIRLPSKRWGWIVTEVSEERVSAVHRDILIAVTQILADFLKTQQLVHHATEADRLQRFSTNVHSSLDLQVVANQIVNDSRLMMNCERVSLYLTERGRTRLLAVSSVAMVERRTELVKAQRALVRVACRLEEPIGSDRPPGQSSVQAALRRYQHKSGFPFLFGIGLGEGKRSTGYLLAESGDDLDRVEFARAMSLLVPQAALAIRNASRYESVPSIFRGMAGLVSRFRLSRVATVLLGMILIAAMMALVKTDYQVRINGELRPLVERVAFAPHDGVVDRVLVKHGEKVRSGQTLLEIRSPEVELALTQNAGEFNRLSDLLDAKQIAINQASSDPNVAPALIGQLTSEISDIEFQLKSLDEERSFLESEQRELAVVSPIGGVVITWMVDELLMGKPVRWGDSLVTIADEEGPWELRFEVPERHIGYLMTARQEGSGTAVDFFFDSNPARQFTTTIASIGNAAEPDPELGPVTMVVCSAPDGDYVRRHGARVSGDVDCGRKSIGYVWTVELIDSIRRRFVW